MLLVPRQLQRHGMTGSVPYYGGRLTPAHIQGMSHAPRPPARPPASAPATWGHAAVPGPPPPPAPGWDVRPPAPGAPITRAGVTAALDYLLRAEVITRAEFDSLSGRGGR
jgi:hypothetical protein